VIDSSRCGHRCQVVKVLARMLVALHVARGEGQQLFSSFAIVRKTGDSYSDADLDVLAGPD